MLTKIHNTTFPIFFHGDEIKYVNSRGLKNFADLDDDITRKVAKTKDKFPDSELDVVFYSIDNVFKGALSLSVDGTQAFLMARYGFVDVSVTPIYIIEKYDYVIFVYIIYSKYKRYNPNDSDNINTHTVWFQPVTYNEDVKQKIGWSDKLSRVTDENIIKQLELELIKKIVNEQEETA